jgi:hypothetical protein
VIEDKPKNTLVQISLFDDRNKEQFQKGGGSLRLDGLITQLVKLGEKLRIGPAEVSGKYKNVLSAKNKNYYEFSILELGLSLRESLFTIKVYLQYISQQTAQF